MYYFCLYKLRGCKKKGWTNKNKKTKKKTTKQKNEKGKKEKINKQTNKTQSPTYIYIAKSGTERLYFPPENSL